EVNTRRIHGRLLRAGTANPVALVADRVVVGSGGGVQPRLTRFASQRPNAACRHNWHVAGVEVGSVGHDASRTGCASVGVIGRINKEGTIFFNDPAVVSNAVEGYRGMRRPVDQVHAWTIAGREVQRDSSSIRADDTLRVLRFV